VLEVVVHKKTKKVEGKFYDVFFEADKKDTSYLGPVHGSFSEVSAAGVGGIEIKGWKNFLNKNTQKCQALENDRAQKKLTARDFVQSESQFNQLNSLSKIGKGDDIAAEYDSPLEVGSVAVAKTQSKTFSKFQGFAVETVPIAWGDKDYKARFRNLSY
jgi:hypothetical protein